jgi:hypothetical protein
MQVKVRGVRRAVLASGEEEASMTEYHVVVYSSPTRGPGKAATEFLSSQGVAFDDVNVMADTEARERPMKLTGQMAFGRRLASGPF